MLQAAFSQARTEFEKKTLPMDEAERSRRINHAFDVAKTLRRNVVQGEKSEGQDNFRLNIHDEIEKGDNETIRLSTPLKGRTARMKR